MSSDGSESDTPQPGSRSGADRLPPPAYPPGHRRTESRAEIFEDPSIPDDAFISPDEPIRKEGRGIPDDAFISPDDPIIPVRRDEDGHVEGLIEIPEPMSGTSSSRRRDAPTIHELPYLLDQLAEKIHERGEGALAVHSDMGHFQAALRSFLKGYLEGSSD